MSFIIGRKKGMTQIWDGDRVVPVTIVEAHPNTISLLRTKERDGYVAVQLKAGKTRSEFRVETTEDFEEGAHISVADFGKGDVVRATGTSKGRGFQGTTKRHGFGGAPATHGQKDKLRAPGSIGTAGAGRVWRGRKMPGRMGADTVTVKNLEVAEVRPEEQLLLIKGAIPGPPGGLIEIIRTQATAMAQGADGESEVSEE